MKAVTVVPGAARVEDMPEPDPATGSVLVEALGVGVCGTDVDESLGSLVHDAAAVLRPEASSA